MEVQILTHEGAILRANRGQPKRWPEGGSTGTVRMPIGVLDGDAHWRHLANTIEPSVCSSNAALCRVTLPTCFTCIQSYTVGNSAPLYPLHDFKALYKYCTIIIIIIFYYYYYYFFWAHQHKAAGLCCALLLLFFF